MKAPVPIWGAGTFHPPLSVAQGSTSPSSKEASQNSSAALPLLSTRSSKSFPASVPLHSCALQEIRFPLLCLGSFLSPRPHLKLSLLRGLLGPPNAHSMTLPYSVFFMLSFDVILFGFGFMFSPTPTRTVCVINNCITNRPWTLLNELMTSGSEKEGWSLPTLFFPPHLSQSPVGERGSSPLYLAFNSPAARSPLVFTPAGPRWGAAPANCCLCANQAAGGLPSGRARPFWPGESCLNFKTWGT